MAKRKCIFRENLTEQFPFIKHSNKGVNFAYCSICNTDINIGNGGISLNKQHLISTKHVSYEHEICTTQSLAVFIRDQNSPISLKIAAAEGAFAFHTVKHHHSFKTMDCTSRLLSVCSTDSEIGKNFHSARTKPERIITGVLAPLSIEEVLAELKSGIKFSLSKVKRLNRLQTDIGGYFEKSIILTIKTRLMCIYTSMYIRMYTNRTKVFVHYIIPHTNSTKLALFMKGKEFKL